MPFAITDSKEIVVHGKEIVEGQLQRDPFAQFTGASNENIVLAVPESAKGASVCTIFIVSDLTGDGVEGNADLADGEDELNFLPFTFKGGLIANSHKSPVDVIMDKTTASNWRVQKKSSLSKWATRRTVREKFYTISDKCTNQVIIKADGSVGATTAELVAGDTFDTQWLDEFLDRAENGWTDVGGDDHPALESYYIEKTSEHGMEQIGEYYPVFVGPKSYKSLTNDPIWKEEQKQQAYQGLSTAVRGFGGVYRNAVIIKQKADTPLKAGILRSDSANFKGYVDFETQYEAGDNTVTELNFGLGAGAMALGFDTEPRYGEDATADSGRKVIAWTDQFFGVKKVRWVGETPEEEASIYHDKDYAVILMPSTII